MKKSQDESNHAELEEDTCLQPVDPNKLPDDPQHKRKFQCILNIKKIKPKAPPNEKVEITLVKEIAKIKDYHPRLPISDKPPRQKSEQKRTYDTIKTIPNTLYIGSPWGCSKRDKAGKSSKKQNQSEQTRKLLQSLRKAPLYDPKANYSTEKLAELYKTCIKQHGKTTFKDKKELTEVLAILRQKLGERLRIEHQEREKARKTYLSMHRHKKKSSNDHQQSPRNSNSSNYRVTFQQALNILQHFSCNNPFLTKQRPTNSSMQQFTPKTKQGRVKDSLVSVCAKMAEIQRSKQKACRAKKRERRSIPYRPFSSMIRVASYSQPPETL